jgi:hypothetical protein
MDSNIFMRVLKLPLPYAEVPEKPVIAQILKNVPGTITTERSLPHSVKSALNLVNIPRIYDPPEYYSQI